jgi:hypothetical protein
MKRTTLGRTGAALGLTILIVSGMAMARPQEKAADSDFGRSIRLGRFRNVSVPLEHLKLRDGRRFYRGSRHLDNVYPYWVASGPDEKAREQGYELRLKNAHALFEPIRTEDQAHELARLMTGGMVVPDESTYTMLRQEALRLKPEATGWGVKLKDGRPGVFGVQVKNIDGGFQVHALVFVCSAHLWLEVVEETYTIAPDRPIQRKRICWIKGPPQARQTAGRVDEAEEARLRAEVQRFRTACLRVLHRNLTPARVKAALSDRPTFAVIRDRLGEPEQDLGSGIHIYLYRLADQTGIVCGVADEDARPTYVRHVQLETTGDPGPAGRLGIGAVLEDLAPLPPGQPANPTPDPGRR